MEILISILDLEVKSNFLNESRLFPVSKENVGFMISMIWPW